VAIHIGRSLRKKDVEKGGGGNEFLVAKGRESRYEGDDESNQVKKTRRGWKRKP